MECREVRAAADSFITGDLPPEITREILRHLHTCLACDEELTSRRALRDGVRRAFESARTLESRPEFITQLRTRLERDGRHGSARRAIRFRGWWAMAAGLLILVSGVAYRGRDWLVMPSALVRAAVRDHRDCALERRLSGLSVPLSQATQRYGDATYGILDRLPSDIETTMGVAHVLRRHACFDAGHQFAHVVFDYRGKIVSLLVTADDGPPTARGGVAQRLTSARVIDNMSVVSFRTARYAVFFTGDIAPADLSALAAVMADPLSREIAGA